MKGCADCEKFLKVARKIIREIDLADYGEGELKNGSCQQLLNAMIQAGWNNKAAIKKLKYFTFIEK